MIRIGTLNGAIIFQVFPGTLRTKILIFFLVGHFFAANVHAVKVIAYGFSYFVHLLLRKLLSFIPFPVAHPIGRILPCQFQLEPILFLRITGHAVIVSRVVAHNHLVGSEKKMLFIKDLGIFGSYQYGRWHIRIFLINILHCQERRHINIALGISKIVRCIYLYFVRSIKPELPHFRRNNFPPFTGGVPGGI